MLKMNGFGTIYFVPDALLMENFVTLLLMGEVVRMLLQQPWWRS